MAKLKRRTGEKKVRESSVKKKERGLLRRVRIRRGSTQGNARGLKNI